jgi:signal transduction histidine kinase/ligand-binding sensor domain-containing protein
MRLRSRLGSIGLLLCICSFFICVPIYGLGRDRSVAQFFHSSWTAKDGAPSQISALTQTADGYLWIGSARGLFRFDGVRFEAYEPPAGVGLPSHNIYALMATPDGGLWVSFRPSGLGFLKDGVMRVFTRPDEVPGSWVYCFARDLDDRIWAGTHTGLALFDGSLWIEIGAEWNFDPRRIRTMFVDREGTLWVATDTTLVFLTRGSKQFKQTGESVGTVSRMAQAPDGRIWITELDTAARPITIAGQDPDAGRPGISGDANDVLFDRDGSLWITSSQGIKRVRFPEKLGTRKLAAGDRLVETYKGADGLTDEPVHNLFEDREGNIWVNSGKGLDRFRYSRLVPVKLPPGHQSSTLLAGDRGEVWAASAVERSLALISGDSVTEQNTPMQISSVYRESNGDVWWGGFGGIWNRRKDGSSFFPQPKDTLADFVWEIIRGQGDGGLWAGLGDVGLFYFRDGEWARRQVPAGLPGRVPSASYQDPAGRTWLGYNENRVCLLDGEQVRSYTGDDGISIGRIKVIRGRGPQIWIGGELGLAVFDNDRFRTVKVANGEQFGTVSGIIELPDGSLWLNELRGIIRISPEEVARTLEDPDHEVTYQLFDFLDGLPGGGQMNYTVSTAIEGTDGRLWFATDNGLAWIDPEHLSINNVPPPVTIRSLSTESKTYQTAEPIDLPQGTQSLSVDYTALSLSVPERVRFRYKLEGADDDWQDAGTRRQAFYNNLRPGNYNFRVIACNNDGVWNEDGALLHFGIAPAFYQTNWFLLLCVAAAAGVMWIAFWWRIRFVKSRMHMRFEERLDERTHIAQELHDTLLQGVFSASVQLDAATEQLEGDARIRPQLDRVSQLMRLVLTEGRNTVRGLHSPNSDNSLVLEKAFAEIRRDLDARGETEFRVLVKGELQPIHPVVRDEIYRFGREALFNAFRHSKAKTIEVEIRYVPKYFKLIVRDDGIGIKPEMLRSGREGHLGLVGMRECSERIGAKLKIESRAVGGTEVDLTVPHRIAFAKRSGGKPFKRLNDIFKRHSEVSEAAAEEDE